MRTVSKKDKVKGKVKGVLRLLVGSAYIFPTFLMIAFAGGSIYLISSGSGILGPVSNIGGILIIAVPLFFLLKFSLVGARYD